MAIVHAVIAGECDPRRLAAHRDGRCRTSVEDIARYLTGTWCEEPLFNVASAVWLCDALDERIAS